MASFNDRRKIEEIAKRYAELLKKQINVNSVYLYGSYAKGTDTADSDIDIAVVGNDFTGDIIEDTLKLMRIRREVDLRIEPHPFRNSDFNVSNPFVREILDTAIKIM